MTGKFWHGWAGEFVLLMGLLGIVGWLAMMLSAGILGQDVPTFTYGLALFVGVLAYSIVRFWVWFHRWLRGEKK